MKVVLRETSAGNAAQDVDSSEVLREVEQRIFPAFMSQVVLQKTNKAKRTMSRAHWLA